MEKLSLNELKYKSRRRKMDVATLENALDEKSKNFWWILSLFLLTSSPGILNSMHITSYVFLADNPVVWCHVPELTNSNWTSEQIRNISSLDTTKEENCYMYDWNYTLFSAIGYEESLNFISGQKNRPDKIKCTSYDYNETISSVVSEWDLVCDATPLKSLVQVAVAVGKFVGAFCFGMVADKFGRKKVFLFCCILYMIAGPIAAIASTYALLLLMRVLIGIAGSGVYEAGYTILSEMTVKKYRTNLGCLYNISYSIGLIFLPIFAYYSSDWRRLQLLLSAPSAFLLIHCWCLPESPRWLMTQGRNKEAWKLIKGPYSEQRPITDANIQSDTDNVQEAKHPWYKKIFFVLQKLFKLFSTKELRRRIIICYFCWLVASMSYFTIALNAHNFTANKYIYVALNGVAEAPGYILPLIILGFIGRKLTGVLLFLIAGISLLIILVIPSGIPIMIVALIGRLCMSAVFAVIILHTSELFPTSNRNTAIGTSLTMAQVGTIIAPFVVDIGGAQAWWIPSTFCGVMSIIAGLLILLLPETRNKPMLDTIQEVDQSNRYKNVSFKNCFSFS
ncbi:organic cation transporter protein isoform X1 [Cimex lectularius]|uniref:Major facilitator superfamily (MFS) profile domain-containing protein n=3 Tax=Cimex lectularius TaxID=79782 RepID=A0A8I6SNN0_CIMLE|nr:organic cation transporter protein isoform X1 [Cimex lectularius]